MSLQIEVKPSEVWHYLPNATDVFTSTTGVQWMGFTIMQPTDLVRLRDMLNVRIVELEDRDAALFVKELKG